MRAIWVSALVLTVMITAVTLSSQQAAPPGTQVPSATVDFAADVQPIFKASCYTCHSGAQPQAGLRLDVRSMAMKGSNGGPVIVPGNSTDSALIHRVNGLGGLRPMPPTGKPLTPEQVAVLTRWVNQGAQWPDALANEENAGIQKHWAYVKPVKPAVPAVKDTAWVKNPIDSFVLARLEKEGLRPTREATRETLIRRVSLDLIGLPPSPAEVDAFVNDKRPDAYERLVDRLLASPQHGERIATPWLDLARYADSNGWSNDRRRPGAYHYRDWVVKAFNNNMPFDQFVIDQIAGDMLPNATIDQKVATGFIRSSTWNEEGGTDPEEVHWNAQVDRTNTVGIALLGSTVECAQCHNHKYDPFLQKDFYSMQAFFNNPVFDPSQTYLPTAQRKFAEAAIELAPPDQITKRDALKAEIKTVETELKNFPNSVALWQAWERSLIDAEEQWQVLQPSRASSLKGSTLSVQQDSSVLVSGELPNNDIYEIEAKSPIAGTITGLQIEAIPDPSLPNGRDPTTKIGGPGRNFYGDFLIHRVELEVGPTVQTLAKVAIKPSETPSGTDDGVGIGVNTVYRLTQVWMSDVQRDKTPDRGTPDGQRVTRRLVVAPEKPFTIAAGAAVRVRIVHDSELSTAALGRFRLSLTTQANPFKVVEVDARLRPLLSIPWEERPKPRSEAGADEQGGVSSQGKAPSKAPSYEQDRLFVRWRAVAPELKPLRSKIDDLEKQIEEMGLAPTFIASENRAIPHPSAFIRVRGVFTDKADRVMAGVPTFLGSLPKDGPQNRLGLAQWLVGPENPLTARVRMNQIWQMFYGQGIVETTEDFGTQGARPSHPELLDWLATEFVDRGWDQKAMYRLIVTSSTYRQASTVTPELMERDPANVLLTRGARFRVEAEMVRDIALTASGLLSTKMGGPAVFPPQPPGLWSFPGFQDTDLYVESQGEDRVRRALYTFIRRTVRYPALTVFDAPSHDTTLARRPRTNTPLQALTTLNDQAFFEAAQAMGQRIIKEGGAQVSSRATYGFRLVMSRRPNDAELSSLVAAFEKERQYFKGHQSEAEKVAGKPDVELAAWTMVSNALLNLDGTVTKE
jgi:hypothetical protein